MKFNPFTKKGKMKIWNTLCEKVAKDKKKNVKEKIFENNTARDFLASLNWSEFYGNLKEQYSPEEFHGQWIPDFALFSDNQPDDPVMLIELKRPNHIQKKKDIIQLTSYLKLTDCQFGLYFGEKLDLFYLENADGKRVAKLVMSVDFTKNNNRGKFLIDMLKNDNFSTAMMEKFCREELALKSICDEWIEDDKKQKLYDFILQECEMPLSLKNRLQAILDIEIKKNEVADEVSYEDDPAANPKAANCHTFFLKEPKKGTNASMIYYPDESKYVILAGSRITASEKSHKDCSPEAVQKRKEVFADPSWSSKDDNVYVLKKNVEFIKDTPNVSAGFCTGRSTNARDAWKDAKGCTFGFLYPKGEQKDTKETIPNITDNKDVHITAKCINRVENAIKKTLHKVGKSSYASKDNKCGYIVKTSKTYVQGNYKKYWFSYRHSMDIDECKNQYVIFCCGEENTIVVIPIPELEAHIENMNTTMKDGQPSYWHVVLLEDKNGKVFWKLSHPDTHLDVSDKKLN